MNSLRPLASALPRAATLAAASAVCGAAASLQAQTTPLPSIFAADAAGPASADHFLNVKDGTNWLGDEFRLVSLNEGNLWLIDNLSGAAFTGAGSSLTSVASGSIVDGADSYISTGFLTPGSWDSGIAQVLGFHREVAGADYYGALTLRYNEDSSFSLLNFGVSLNAFDTASLLAVPEPATAAALALAVGAGIATLGRRRKVAKA